MSIKKIESRINEVISALQESDVRLKGKRKLIGKLRSSRDLAKNIDREEEGSM